MVGGKEMKKAAWILPVFIEGSGGHRTIFQNVQYLAEHGFECSVYVEDKGQAKNSDELEKLVNKYFGKHTCKYYLGYELQEEYDIIFATAWYTAKIVRDYPSKAKKAYFIQDFEALFNPMGDGYLMACNSYCYGLHPITIGRWLSNKMDTEYHTPSQYFDFCADKKIYRNLKREREKAICFIYQPDKPRRCSQLGIEALGIVKHLRPDVKIYLYGSDITGHVWFEHENLKIIPIDKCNELYNRCSVGLCISSSNPSRIPFEMMAAGLPVVDLYMDNNLYDMPDGGVCLAHYTPESIAQALIDILDNKEKAKKMSECGQKYMEHKSLEYGFEQFYQAVEKILSNMELMHDPIEKVYNKEPIMADSVAKMLPKGDYGEENYLIQDDSFIGKLKRNRFIRNNKLVRKIYFKLRGL